MELITITDKAIQQIHTISQAENPDGTRGLRLAVSGGGCSGLKYNMDFTNQSNEDDQIFEHQDLKVVTNKKSLLYLIGTELDYSDGLNGKGFEWNNPQATRTCGCGESFSL